MNNVVNKEKSVLKTIAIIFLVIGICNFSYLFYYEMAAMDINNNCCTMADDTEQDIRRKSQLREESAKRAALAKEKVVQIQPICSDIGVISLVSLIGLFIVSYVKNERKNIKVLIGVFIVVNILLVLIEIGG